MRRVRRIECSLLDRKLKSHLPVLFKNVVLLDLMRILGRKCLNFQRRNLHFGVGWPRRERSLNVLLDRVAISTTLRQHHNH
jgi:hypothetical protein